MEKGFVYILRNKALANKLKIGQSTKIPEYRAKELSTTGVPSPFYVSYYCITKHAKSAEREIHKELADFRHADNREFFNVDLTYAVKKIRALCQPEHEWSNEILIKSKDGRPLNLPELNNRVHGISICSRRNKEDQIIEMVNFCEMAYDNDLSHLVESLLYCSNSDTCSFEFSNHFNRHGEDAHTLRAVARETITQFDWLGTIDHGKSDEELFE